MIDEEDLELLGRGAMLVLALILVIALAAFAVFVLVASFELARGL